MHIPQQTFDTPARFDFAKRLKFNPWHSLPKHRPLGNQSRALFRMHETLPNFRKQMNQTSHMEPTGDETF